MGSNLDYSIVFVKDEGIVYEWLTRVLLTSIKENTGVEDVHILIPEERDVKVPDYSSSPIADGLKIKIHEKENPLLGEMSPGALEEVGWRVLGLEIETQYSKRLILDTDTMIVNDPNPTFLESYNFALAPTQGETGPTLQEWKKYYSHYSLELPKKRITAQNGSKIFPLWNPGAFFIDGFFDFSETWIETILELDSNFSLEPLHFADMIALPIAISRIEEKIKTIPSTYNYHPRIGSYKFPRKLKILHFAGPKGTDWYMARKRSMKVDEILNKAGFQNDMHFLVNYLKEVYGTFKANLLLPLILLKEKQIIDLEKKARGLRKYI